MTREEIIRDKKYYVFLEELRKSAITNMYGATHYLQEAYDLSREEAKTYLVNYLNDAGQIQATLYRDLTRSRGERRDIISKVLDNEEILDELYDVCDNAPINFTVGKVVDIYDDIYDSEINDDDARGLLQLFVEGYDYLEYRHEKELRDDMNESLFDESEEDFSL